jgi:cytochrome c553
VLHAHDGGEAVLPRDHRAVGHQAAYLRHQARDRDEQGRPAGVM